MEDYDAGTQYAQEQYYYERDKELAYLRAELEQVRGERDEAKRVFARWLDEHTDSAARIRLLEAVAEAFNAEWDSAPECTCHEAYKSRNRDDPDCLYHKSPLLWDALAAWREGEA